MNSIWTNHLNLYWFAIKTCRMCLWHTHTHTHTHPWHICCVILKRKLLLLFPELLNVVCSYKSPYWHRRINYSDGPLIIIITQLQSIKLSLSLSFSVLPSRLCWCFSDPYSSGSSLKLSDQSSTDIKKPRKKERKKEKERKRKKYIYIYYIPNDSWHDESKTPSIKNCHQTLIRLLSFWFYNN